MVARPTSASSGNPEMMGQMEETIANLERAKQQSWEEKQRLTELYEQERQNSLANEKKILGFMQTVKQEKMDIMKKIKVLRQKKVQLSKEMRVRKQSYVENKSKLQQGVQAFTQMKTETPREKQHLMEQIESRKSLLITDRDELSRLKEELKFCEEKLVEEEAEVAAKSALLEEDDKLRRAIQDDEREKMKRERAAYLQSALDEERQRFQLEADNDKQRLKVALEATADKEKKLAEEVEKQRNRALQLQQQMHQMQLEHNEWKDTTKKVEIHSRIRHENILPLFATFQDATRVYLVMKYAGGGDLYKKMRSMPGRRFPERQAMLYTAQLVSALEACHQQHVIHRDIKPENLLLSQEGTIQLGDFGWSSANVTAANRRDTLCGTLDYLSPEMIRGEKYDESVDIWAVGIIMYELLVGKPPFEAPVRASFLSWPHFEMLIIVVC
ncbi:protein kinase, putative [Phytophthora infestans T30-4]|uniref:Protein kinase, putative n=1 Tax=Phytophthora infestans (strain T30-4) TaxID=403677 RepID=D0P090_PHYIT|nr:protein kinase, putative [Phytophthora infestans T30-4]EEY70264.1 protein kinase, putative [Phytophthora infestans T30-4]|eukprot:XP_002996984.1 protein kinase, putative [Phytophthora infestans T30-4]